MEYEIYVFVSYGEEKVKFRANEIVELGDLEKKKKKKIL